MLGCVRDLGILIIPLDRTLCGSLEVVDRGVDRGDGLEMLFVRTEAHKAKESS